MRATPARPPTSWPGSSGDGRGDRGQSPLGYDVDRSEAHADNLKRPLRSSILPWPFKVAEARLFRTAWSG
jgi:hypothetical protein